MKNTWKCFKQHRCKNLLDNANATEKKLLKRLTNSTHLLISAWTRSSWRCSTFTTRCCPQRFVSHETILLIKPVLPKAGLVRQWRHLHCWASSNIGNTWQVQACLCVNSVWWGCFWTLVYILRRNNQKAPLSCYQNILEAILGAQW